MKGNSYSEYSRQVLQEIDFILRRVNASDLEVLIEEILKANTIVVAGAGRVGMAAKGFGMRLGHLGFRAFTLGDSTVPAIGKGDLLLVASGSGETQTIYDIASIAKRNGATVLLVTGRKESRMGGMADAVVLMRVPSKVQSMEGFSSIQPMTTLNEQCLQILFDIIVLMLMEKKQETHETMWKRHSNLE